MQVTITVNGSERSADVEPRMLLVHFIREVLELTGTHVGCDTTSCGACTILLDGTPVKSCINTRAGMKAISFSCFAVGFQLAKASISGLLTWRLSSCLSKFSSKTFKDTGNREIFVKPAFPNTSRRKIS